MRPAVAGRQPLQENLMTAFMTRWGHAPCTTRRERAALMLAALVVTAALPTQTAQAQRDRRLGGVPRDVVHQVTDLWNAPATRRVRGDFSLAAGDTVRSDLAILGGRAQLAGVVTGQVVVLNGDAVLVAGARIERDLTVLGGTLESADRPDVRGEIRVWSARYRYREEGDSLVAESDRLESFTNWARDRGGDESGGQIFVTTAHTYNRVEGLPIYVGPRFRVRNGDLRVRGELFGIFRTGDGIRWERENLGHRALLEIRRGNTVGVALGGRLFDEVDAVEDWQLTKGEVGLNSVLFTRDYRDYWQRHGAQGYLSLFAGRGNELRVGYGEERWSSRRARDVFSLFNSDIAWRRNPAADEGVLRLLTVSGAVDTRNNIGNPRRGWLLRAEVERGTGAIDVVAPVTAGVTPVSIGDIEYTRGLMDLRRYNSLGPGAQLNLRVVLGGHLGGDRLPLQRRFAVSGIDALPGFDFRRTLNSADGSADAGTCSTANDAAYAQLGRPAQCERMALLQVEWKGDFRVNLFGDDNDEDYGDRRWMLNRVKADGAWVIFANSGRGWLAPAGRAVLDVPPLSTWRTDLGGGFDFGDFGVYVAQAVSESGQSPNVYVRLSRRF